MNQTKKRGLILCIIFGAVIIVILISLITRGILLAYRENVRDQDIRSHTFFLYRVQPASKVIKGEREIDYYGTVNEALLKGIYGEANASPNEKLSIPEEKNKIFEKSSDELLFNIWLGEHWPKVPDINLFVLKQKETKYSYPLYLWIQPIISEMDGRMTYEDQDRIMRDIVASYYHEDITMQVNDGLPIYYGIGISENMKDMKILGKRPDQIKEVCYKNNKYNFWYYKDGSFISELFKNKEHELIEEFSMEEGINYFKITFN